MESLFANRPHVTVLPHEETDATQAELMQTLLDWQLEERVNIRNCVGRNAQQSMVIYGPAVLYTGWERGTTIMCFILMKNREV